MRLYLGSVIINRLPLCRQSGEICLRYAQTYRLIDDDSRHIEVPRARILRQILANDQAEVQRQTFVFIDNQLRFNQGRQLFTDLIKLFVLQILRSSPVTSSSSSAISSSRISSRRSALAWVRAHGASK